MYVHQKISENLQRRLYKDHTIVIPVQESPEYVNKTVKFAPYLDGCSRRMKLSTSQLVVEVSQTQPTFLDDGAGRKTIDFWDREEGGGAFARKMVSDLLDMKSQLPNVKSIKFIFWCNDFMPNCQHWVNEVLLLQKQWNNMPVKIQLHTFDYEDPDAGDGGYNQVQMWQMRMEEDDDMVGLTGVDFLAIDFKEDAVMRENWVGRELDPKAWSDEDFLDIDYDDVYEAVRRGEIYCPPLYVSMKADTSSVLEEYVPRGTGGTQRGAGLVESSRRGTKRVAGDLSD
jgi:hypothetical protein